MQRALTSEAKNWVGDSEAGGAGLVAVPPRLRKALLDHVRDDAQPGQDGLLFWRDHRHVG